MRPKTLTGVIAVVLGASGFAFGSWFLVFCGIVLSLAVGNTIVSLVLAVLADCVYGAPTGWIRVVLPLPFTMTALAVLLVRFVLAGYMRDDVPAVL